MLTLGSEENFRYKMNLVFHGSFKIILKSKQKCGKAVQLPKVPHRDFFFSETENKNFLI